MNSAFLFDLDNTLYPADSGITEALERQMNAYVANITGLDETAAATLRQQYFHTYGTTLRGLQLHHHVDSEDYLETVHQLPIAECIQPNPALVDRLTRLTVPFAIFTNSPREHAVRVLHQMGFNEIFFPIIDVRMMQFQPKPHPSAYQIALEVIACHASSVYLFEDTLHNLAYAHSIGMRTIYIGAHAHASLPDYVDASFATAVAALDSLATF